MKCTKYSVRRNMIFQFDVVHIPLLPDEFEQKKGWFLRVAWQAKVKVRQDVVILFQDHHKSGSV